MRLMRPAAESMEGVPEWWSRKMRVGAHERLKPGSTVEQPSEETIMSVPYPSPKQLQDAAAEIGLSLTEQDVTSYLCLIKPMVDAYNIVDRMPDELPPV